MTLAVNKIQYQMDSYLKDPAASNHAKQVAAQAVQDKKVADAKAAAAENKAIINAKNAEDKAAAEDLAKRSKFSSPQSFLGKAASKMLSIFTILIILGLALYAGKLEANKAIGYSVPMRIVSFIYGALFFFIVIPRSLYDIYGLKKTLPDYAPLPIWNYVPNGQAEQIFLGAFSYVEDADSKAAREVVVQLYKSGVSGITVDTKPVASPVASPKPEMPPKGIPVAMSTPTTIQAMPPKGVPVAMPTPTTQV